MRIGRYDFVRHFVQNHERTAAFNTSHFLHEHDDLVSHHSGYGDAIGLMVSENTILRPPLYRRGCLLFDGTKWTVQTMSLEDVAMILPGDICLRADDQCEYQFQLNPSNGSPIAIYTRAAHLGKNGRPLNRTPAEDSRHEFIIVNRQVLGWKLGGNLQIPQNGFILSLQAAALPESTIALIANDAWIEYEFADLSKGLVSGIQAGPVLVNEGRNVLDLASANEEYWASSSIGGEHIVGITPVKLDPGSRTERKARTALGIKDDGSLLLVVVDGSDPASRTELDSAGATLFELADWLGANGAVHALNMSGEGSTHLFVQGGLVNRPSDRRGQKNVVYERMLASIGIVGLVIVVPAKIARGRAKSIDEVIHGLPSIAFETVEEGQAIGITIIQTLHGEWRERLSIFAPPADIQIILQRIVHAVCVCPVGLVDRLTGAIEYPGHVGHAAIGAMTCAIQGVDENRPANAKLVAQRRRVTELLLH